MPDVFPEYIRWDPDQARLVTMLMGFKKMREVHNVRFSLWEERPIPQTIRVNGAQTDIDTAIEFATGTGLPATLGMLLLVDSTREILRVTVPGADAATVTRSFGDNSGPAAAIPDGDTLLLIGTAFADGAGRGTPISYLDTEKFNYTQRITEDIAVTRQGAMTKLYGGKNYTDVRETATTNHKRKIQNALCFGQLASTTESVTLDGTAQTMNLRATSGLEEQIVTNVFDLANTRPSWKAFMQLIKPAFIYGDNGYQKSKGDKHAFLSMDWMLLFSEWGWDKVQYNDVNTESSEIKGLGVSVRKLNFPYGSLFLHPMFEFENTPSHRGLMFILDLAHIGVAYTAAAEGFPSGKPYLKKDIQDNGLKDEAKHDQLAADLGLHFEIEAAHGIVKRLGLS